MPISIFCRRFSWNLIAVSAGLMVILLGRLTAAADAPEVWTEVNDDDPAASYSPGMEVRHYGEFFRSDTHVSQTAGTWASFSFTGTGVKWIGSKNSEYHSQRQLFRAWMGSFP